MATTTLVKNNVVDVKKMAKRVFSEKEPSTASEKDSITTRNPSSPLVKEKKKKKKKKMMEQCKKNQCWVIVKRMIVGKDGWALKKSLDLKVLKNYEEIKEEFKIITMKTIGLEDIETKLNKLLYSKTDEFADDMRLVFSRAFLYPPKTQIHRIARKLSESFEKNWKSLKEKWTLEDRERKRVCNHK